MKATIHLHLKPKCQSPFNQKIDVNLPPEVLNDEDELREALIDKPVLVSGSYGTGKYTSRYHELSILEKLVMEPNNIDMLNDFIIKKVEIQK